MPEDLLRLGERAAFHGSPTDGVRPLTSLLAMAGDLQEADDLQEAGDPREAGDLPGEKERARWLLGVCLGARGSYGDAFATLEPLRTTNTRWASMAESTLGSLHRQLGRHAEAKEHDEQALESAADQESLVEAQLGRAADAVGLNQPQEAKEWLVRATTSLNEDQHEGQDQDQNEDQDQAKNDKNDEDGWRLRVRAAWVTAEVALLTGDLEGAKAPAAHAVALAEKAEAPRHLAKSLLFAGLAEHDLAKLQRAWRLSTQIGARPLIWPAALLLLEHEQEQEGHKHEQEQMVRNEARLAVHAIIEGLPAEIAVQWRQGADLRRLLAD